MLHIMRLFSGVAKLRFCRTMFCLGWNVHMELCSLMPLKGEKVLAQDIRKYCE